MAGFSCPYWTGYEKYNIGLWLVCSPRDCRSQSTISPLFGGWLVVSSPVLPVPVLAGLCGDHWTRHTGHLGRPPCLDLGPYSVHYLNRRPRHRHFLMAGSAFAGVCGIAGDAIFVAKINGEIPTQSDVEPSTPPVAEPSTPPVAEPSTPSVAEPSAQTCG
ncbi:hypothetical protein V1264_011539 [Littorina saxatilis]|uniref:Uncharacterized protein n=1 Tax=Littorina saxatilis TaxID=31220 RepID=A0AAN9BV83_9CAEN